MRRRRFLQGALALAVAGIRAGDVTADTGQAVRRLRFNLGFRNPFARVLEKQRFRCYLPADIPGQRLIEVVASVPHRLLRDALGHTVLELGFDAVPAFAHKLVTVRCAVELQEATAPSPLPDPAPWLTSARFVESDHPDIGRLAAELGRPAKVDNARAIYDWVVANIAYAGYLADEFGALHALSTRRGDCTEFADLVAALARASGIPARVVGGHVAQQDLLLRPEDYHNWAELHLDGGWRIVDAQKQHWYAPRADYVSFRVHGDPASALLGTAHRYRLDGELQVSL